MRQRAGCNCISQLHYCGSIAFRRRRYAARARGASATATSSYLLVAPSIFVLLLIGIFPLVYLLVVSFQGITMTETDTGFVGLAQLRAVVPRSSGCGKRCCTR